MNSVPSHFPVDKPIEQEQPATLLTTITQHIIGRTGKICICTGVWY
ncbi:MULTISPECIES: hypothetical protein [Shewanella]|nr:hypothetical protein [Shewanella psychromarinicola]MCL1083369.1 hypothetical protein [Shewanella psychromarinicola]